MSFAKIVSLTLNDPAKPIAPGFEYHLKLLKSDDIPRFLKRRENFYRALQMAVFQFSFDIPDYQKVAFSHAAMTISEIQGIAD
jgi:hypothetical protein